MLKANAMQRSFWRGETPESKPFPCQLATKNVISLSYRESKLCDLIRGESSAHLTPSTPVLRCRATKKRVIHGRDTSSIHDKEEEKLPHCFLFSLRKFYLDLRENERKGPGKDKEPSLQR